MPGLETSILHYRDCAVSFPVRRRAPPNRAFEARALGAAGVPEKGKGYVVQSRPISW